jgi:hypothetical protein
MNYTKGLKNYIHLKIIPILIEANLFVNSLYHRVLVNGVPPIADPSMDDLGIYCDSCGLPASRAVMISGHSAGVFNTTIYWGNR